jgi:hypothetical protein
MKERHMRNKLNLIAFSAVVAIFLIGAPSASAATEFGDNCSATAPVTTPYTFTTLSASAGSLPLTAPTNGVITKVKMQLGISLPLAIPQQAKLLKPAGGNNFTVTNQTDFNVSTGQTVADARMPVVAGERLALHGLPFTYSGTSYPGYEFICPDEGSVLGGVTGDVPPGSTGSFEELAPAKIPLAAVIEADADNDGFGDETQDACPQSATTQAACPPVTLSTSKQVKKGAVVIVVTTDIAAPVSVNGVAKLGKGKKAKIKGGTKNLVPGKLAKFTLTFPQRLKLKLRELSPKQKLTLKVTVAGTSVAGAVTKKTLKVKLKGQAKP